MRYEVIQASTQLVFFERRAIRSGINRILMKIMIDSRYEVDMKYEDEPKTKIKE